MAAGGWGAAPGWRGGVAETRALMRSIPNSITPGKPHLVRRSSSFGEEKAFFCQTSCLACFFPSSSSSVFGGEKPSLVVAAKVAVSVLLPPPPRASLADLGQTEAGSGQRAQTSSSAVAGMDTHPPGPFAPFRAPHEWENHITGPTAPFLYKAEG